MGENVMKGSKASRWPADRAFPARTTVPHDPIPHYTGRGRLTGRRALVVGGLVDGTGPGREVAAALAKEGAAVAVADDPGGPSKPAAPQGWRRATPTANGVPADPLHTTARMLADLGACALPVRCDPTREADCRGAVAHTTLEFGGIDLLVVCGPGPRDHDGLMDITTDRLDRTLRATFYSALWLIQAARVFLPAGASIVLTGAPSGDHGSPEHIDHAAGAAGVMSLPRSLAGILADRGVRINCLVPAEEDDPHDVAAAYVDLAREGVDLGTGAVLSVAGITRRRPEVPRRAPHGWPDADRREAGAG
ncbi:hypothetical protein GCM10027294_12570 [Marinactinospora endophytica]